MTTNAERAEFRARRRGHTFQFPPPREVEAWSAPIEDRSLFRMVLCGLLLALLVVLGLGFFTRAAEDFKHEAWAKQAVDECVANGQTPHVYRDNRDYVLGVRCE